MRRLAFGAQNLMLDQEDPPPFSSFFGEVDDGGDYESAGDVRARDAESPRVQLDTIDETDLRAVTRRIGDELPHLAAELLLEMAF